MADAIITPTILQKLGANSTPPLDPSEQMLGEIDVTAPRDQASINFKVRLVSILEMVQGAPGDFKQVIFEVTPTLTESRAVDYSTVQPIHMPGGIQVYKFSGSRSFELTAHLISRNTADALQNMLYLQTLRSWQLPFFGRATSVGGANTPQQASLPQEWSTPLMTPDQQMRSGIDQVRTGSSGNAGSISLLGAPPEVLYLYGYSSSNNDDRQSMKGVNINRIPVVMTNLNITYPEDVDYLPVEISPTANTEPFPVKMEVNISLVETHSPTEYEQFSLENFKSGKLVNF